MKQKEVFKKIGGIIQELSDQYEYLKTVNGDLNDLELELFVANAHFLTDHIEILCKLNLQNSTLKRSTEKQETAREQKYFEPVVQQMMHNISIAEEKPDKAPAKQVEIEITSNNKHEEQPVPEIDLASESSADTYSFVQEEPETIRHELILDESMVWDDDENIPIEEEIPEGANKRKAGSAAKAEVINGADELKDIKPADKKKEAEVSTKKTAEEVLTINQKMSSQLGDKVMARTEQLSVKPISDIKLAITLNDKLLYVKDLFNGYNLAYSEAIEILNRFNTFEEASRFLKTNYVTKNNWESKPATTEKFYALLKRRYA
jgi:hypothetical protein